MGLATAWTGDPVQVPSHLGPAISCPSEFFPEQDLQSSQLHLGPWPPRWWAELVLGALSSPGKPQVWLSRTGSARHLGGAQRLVAGAGPPCGPPWQRVARPQGPVPRQLGASGMGKGGLAPTYPVHLPISHSHLCLSLPPQQEPRSWGHGLGAPKERREGGAGG